MIVFILSLVAIYCLLQRHLVKNKWFNEYLKNHENHKVYFQFHEKFIDKEYLIHMHNEEKKSVSLIFWCEMGLLLLCPVPYFDLYVTHTARAGS